MAILPEIQQERQRQDIQTLLAARIKGVDHHPGGKEGKRGNLERTGGEEGGANAQLVINNGDKPKSANQTGPPLTVMGKR